MHLGDCLGGYIFYDDKYENMIEEPRYVEQDDITKNVFSADSRILEINSKSGLYPLYMAYGIYRTRLKEKYPDGNFELEQQLQIWDSVVAENIFVICKTPMAKSITRRTLVGFRNAKVNTRYFEDLINQITNKTANFVEKVQQGKSYWKSNNNDNMKFNAIVGNPPYQVMDGGNKASAIPAYNLFVDVAKKINPDYISMIIPAKWYNGGRGLDDFRTAMLNDTRIKKLVDYEDSNDCFNGVDIAGGVCYFLWDKLYSGLCYVVNIKNGKSFKQERKLFEYKTFIRESKALSIIEKIKKRESKFLNSKVSSRKPFGLATNVKPNREGNLVLRFNGGKGKFKETEVLSGINWINKWKVITSYLTYDHAGRADKEGKRRIISTLEILTPNEICTETYIVIDAFDTKYEAVSLYNYIKTKFCRFLILQITSTQHITKSNYALVPLQNFTSSSDINWNKPVSDIDRQLYVKYGLTEEEAAFIESMIKPME